MNNQQDFEQELTSIRQLMERSVRFISFSGLAGILAGLYALAGAAVAFYRIPGLLATEGRWADALYAGNAPLELLTIGVVVLAASLVTGFWLTARKAKRLGASIWDSAGRRMLINLSVPLVAGGLFILVLLAEGYIGLVPPACLIFYGLALISASPNLVDEVRYLGYMEIILGLIASAYPGFAVYFWAVGFGILHILYGAILYRKYDA